MPRVSFAKSHRSERFDALLEDLVHELTTDRDRGQPLILESPAGPDKVTVHVVWDRWKDVPEEQRGPLVQEAYHRAFGSDYDQRILFVLGLPLAEAVRLGLLPWIVEPNRWRATPKASEASVEEYRKAIETEEGAVYFAEHGPQLRFPSLEMADAARDRLAQQLQNSKWMIIEEIPAE